MEPMITELEKKLKTIRTTEEYQRMYRMVEELDAALEKHEPADSQKMVEVCRYVYPDLWPEDYFETLEGEDLEEEYMECAECIKAPYACYIIGNIETVCEYRCATLEMAFINAFERWRTDTLNYEREKYNKSEYVVAGISESHDEYCVFKRDCNVDEVARILQMEYLVNEKHGLAYHWLRKFCAFAEEIDPEFDPILRSPMTFATEEEEMKTIKRAEEILGISITEW